MPVETHQLEIRTQGNTQVLNLSDSVTAAIQSGRIHDGIVCVSVVGSTASITTTEFEPGLATRDLKQAFEGIAPESGDYLHEQTWNDDNGHSHVRATLVGPSVTLPLVAGELQLGTWQQIVLLDFDTRPRSRRIVIQVIG